MPRKAPPRWMGVQEALRSPDVSADDKLAIGAACIEEDALMRTAQLMAGDKGAPAWYVAHGGRFRFSEDGERLMIEIPVRPFVLAPVPCARRGCGLPKPAHDELAHAFQAPDG